MIGTLIEAGFFQKKSQSHGNFIVAVSILYGPVRRCGMG